MTVTLELLTQPEIYVSLLTLTAMEIVLGIDNVIFISILASKLPAAQQPTARRLGLALALVMRLGLVFAISWVMGLTAPLFDVLGKAFSGRDLILLVGGLFLVGKSTHEIYDKMEVAHEDHQRPVGGATFGIILFQILLLDVVFSLDSVITAVGMAQHVSVMVIAMVVAVGVMLAFAGRISDFVNRHPSMKILALCFLLLIGVMLIADGMGQHIGKGYIYFAMSFSLGVEFINMRLRRRNLAPVTLHHRFEQTTALVEAGSTHMSLASAMPVEASIISEQGKQSWAPVSREKQAGIKPIVCGTDFSENSACAADAACAIAKRLFAPVRLVHVTHVRNAGGSSGTSSSIYDSARDRLRAHAEELRARFEIDVESMMEVGNPDERLVAVADDLKARLLVIAALGEHKQKRWLVGSVAERVAQSASVPVLVVRDGRSIEAWALGDRSLRVMVGVELTATSKAALGWARDLTAIGPLDLLVAQIAWPPDELQRSGSPGPVPLDHFRPDLAQSLLGALETWGGKQIGDGTTSYIVRPGWGRIDTHLTLLAEDAKVNLLVVGTHQRHRLGRFWQGSVSRGVLHSAAMNVVCVPSAEVELKLGPVS